MKNLKLNLASLLLASTLSAPTWAALSLDGHASASTASGNTVPVAGLTTVNANDIIVVGSVNSAATNNGIVSVSDTAGLTWIHHGAACVVSGALSVEIWYAISSGTLSNDTVTVTYNGPPTARVDVDGISGANTSAPFDTGSAFPLCHTATTGSSNTNTFTTSNANTLIYSIMKVSTAFTSLTPPSGSSYFTGSPFTSAAWTNKIVAATQTGVSNTFSWTGGSQNNDQLMTAFQQASPPSPPPPPVSATGLLDTAF